MSVPAPFHDRPAAPSPSRRLLLLSYHFPPSQSAGALRWQKLARFALERGWGLDVVCLDPAAVTRADWARLDDLPDGVRAHGVAQPELWAERFNRLALAVRRALRPRRSAPADMPSAAPARVGTGVVHRDAIRWRFTAPGDWVRAFDAWLFFARERAWARQAAVAARALLAWERYDALITCGPPHMTHPVGAALAARARVPLIIDLRDPWSLATAISTPLASPMWYAIARRGERLAVNAAALVVLNTATARDAMAAAYPAARERIMAVMNGCDDEIVPPARRGARFVVAYAGAIYLDRDPSALFAAAARVVRALSLTPHQFGLEFIGNVAGGADALRALARQAGVEAFLTAGPSRPRQAMLEFLAGAAVLVSLPQDLPLTLPSKIFEYMQFDAWILAMAKTGSATEQALRGSGADVVDPSDVDALAAVLQRRYEQFTRDERPRRLAVDPRFSRRGQATLLFDAIERVARR